ncbi:hypothetical protein BD560DRAFT_415237 [Blakeslea trispora]|nr:hypothetical protein BD560DRAFT_415237 [Blakeslea trispora]
MSHIFFTCALFLIIKFVMLQNKDCYPFNTLTLLKSLTFDSISSFLSASFWFLTIAIHFLFLNGNFFFVWQFTKERFYLLKSLRNLLKWPA